MSERMTKVTADEFYAYVASYPRKLERDTKQFIDPPLRAYHDFSGGKPDGLQALLDTVVATYTYADGPDGPESVRCGWRVRR